MPKIVANSVRKYLSQRPRNVKYLMEKTGLTDKQLRDGIDALRDGIVPIWRSQLQKRFWTDNSPFPGEPPGVGDASKRWIKEP